MSRQPIHVLVPMSGQGVRYQKAGYDMPKPLVPVSGRLMIERVLEAFPESWPCHFVMAENHRTTKLPEVLKQLRPKGSQTFVPVHKEGPLRALEEGIKLIPDEAPVLVSYCDYGMVWDAKQFERFVSQTNCDACLISYTGFHAHYLSSVPYAYSRLDGERVVEVKEKGSFTSDREQEYASCGAYYFRTARLLREALEYQRKNELKLNGEFYTSLTVEALLQMNKNAHVRVFEIPGFFQWGTPEDLWRFEYWEKTYAAYNATKGRSPGDVAQLLMPMAGLGSRFKNLTPYPKPFIPVDGVPMFERALRSLPKAREKSVFVGLRAFSALAKKFSMKGSEFILLEETPPGQALTTKQGAEVLNKSGDVVVSSCDHGIVLESKRWNMFANAPDCEAAIFTVTGFPGAKSNPRAFAYVVPVGDGEFPLVKDVSVKVPVSETPDKDNLLVGTFWFKNAAVLTEAIDKLVASGKRVNNEIYLDSVFEMLIKEGRKVRMIPLDGYINWGDPDSLAEALYWYEVFCGRRIDKRDRFPGLTLQWPGVEGI